MSIDQLRPVMAVDWPRPSMMALASVLAWEASSAGHVRLLQSWAARQLGCSAETVSRSIAQLVEADIIRIGPRGRGHYIWNPAALASLAEYVDRLPLTLAAPVPPRDTQDRTPDTLTRDTRAAILRHGFDAVLPDTASGTVILAPPHSDDDDCPGNV